MMRKRSRKNELMMRRFAIIFGIVAILSVLAAGTAFVGIYVFKILPIGSAGSMSPPNLSGVVSQSSGTANGTYSGKAEKNRQEIYQGNLILVNNETEYRLDSETHLGSVFDLRSQSYKSQDKNVRLDKNVIQNLNQMMDAFAQNTGKTDVMIASGYRDRELQTKLYREDLESRQTSTSLFVTKPGFSEHHTGLSFDLGLWPTNGFHREYTGSGEYQWIAKNCYRYGFVVRYKSDKVNVTKIGNEPWHIRYVGVPHAYIMEKENLCLEEYIQYLKNFPYEGNHLMVTDDQNHRYEIYYKAAPAGQETVSVPVPENEDYDISGNNIDGFIVTITLS